MKLKQNEQYIHNKKIEFAVNARHIISSNNKVCYSPDPSLYESIIPKTQLIYLLLDNNSTKKDFSFYHKFPIIITEHDFITKILIRFLFTKEKSYSKSIVKNFNYNFNFSTKKIDDNNSSNDLSNNFLSITIYKFNYGTNCFERINKIMSEIHNTHQVNHTFLVNNSNIKLFKIEIEGIFIDSSSPNYSLKFKGIIDEGNTSYFEAIIQLLFHFSLIRKYIYKASFSSEKNSIISLLNDIMFQLENFSETNTPISIVKILNYFSEKVIWNKLNEISPILSTIFEVIAQHIEAINFMSLFTSYTINSTLNYSFSHKPIIPLIIDDCNSFEECINTYLSNIKITQKFIPSPIMIFEFKRFNQGNIINKKITFPSFFDFSQYNNDKNDHYLLSSVISYKNEIENMNNNGKFVTYIKIKNEQWIKLDGTLTKRVSSYDVIENNFGGIIIDYEISRDYKSLLEYEKKIKQFAYILIYIRKNYIDEIFCEVNLNDIHENVVIRNQQFGFSHQLFL